MINGTYTPGPETLQAVSGPTDAVRMATLDLNSLTVFPTDTVAPPASDTAEPTETTVPSATAAPTEIPTDPPTVTAVPPTPIPPTAVPPTIAPPTIAPQPTAIPTVAQAGPPNFDHNGDGKVTCDDFSTQAEAQIAYEAGYRNLDGNDNDGLACESKP
ncbi:MAG TPA: excalibur calcium-binding domain-containing protein [Anaerolineales bacterium]|nr:excalibur calcium-binding domain-containing protein [Anaerolineales bacterium]